MIMLLSSQSADLALAIFVETILGYTTYSGGNFSNGQALAEVSDLGSVVSF